MKRYFIPDSTSIQLGVSYADYIKGVIGCYLSEIEKWHVETAVNGFILCIEDEPTLKSNAQPPTRCVDRFNSLGKRELDL